MTAIVVDDSDQVPRAAQVRGPDRASGEGTLEERPDLTNRSLTAPEAEAVRAFNAAFRKAGLGARLHNRVINLGAGTRMKLRVPPPDWTRIETPAWAIERADAIAHEIVAGIAASGVRVVGDLDALQGVAGVSAAATPAEPGPGDDRVPSEIAAELALGVLLAGGAAPEGRAIRERLGAGLDGEGRRPTCPPPATRRPGAVPTTSPACPRASSRGRSSGGRAPPRHAGSGRRRARHDDGGPRRPRRVVH